MFYYSLVELLTPPYDTTIFHGHWPSNREVTQGEQNPLPLPALPDSEKPGLFMGLITAVETAKVLC